MSQSRDLEGRVFLVTGANTGIGRATAEAFARRGGRVFLACRSEERAGPVLDAIRTAGGNAEFLPIDLADLSSVRRAAERFLTRGEPLHVLVNNAGMGGRRALTKDGFELTFGVNHLGHFLLTLLLWPRLSASGPARVLNVASIAHRAVRTIDWDALRRPAGCFSFQAYRVSKLCNVLFTKELARRRGGQGVTSYAVHPGVVASDIWRRVPWPARDIAKRFMITNEEGARTTMYCATSEEVALHDGRYYEDAHESPSSRASQDPALASELWERSERWCAEHLAR